MASSNDAAAAVEVRLTYYNGRGHGERVRYALAAANVPYTESFLTRPGDVDAVCSKCLFGQAPLFESDGVRFVQSPLLEMDGLQLSNSWATVRHLAQKNDLTPPTEAAAAKADAVMEQVRDYTVAGGFTAYGWAPGFFENTEIRDACLAHVAAAASRYLPTFEAAVEDGGFIVGSTPCWADFQLLYLLNYTEELLPTTLASNYQRLAQLRSALNADARMQKHFAAHAKGLVSPPYMLECKEAQRPRTDIFL